MTVLVDIKLNLENLRYQLMVVRSEYLFQKFVHALAAKFDASQPRDEIGRWTTSVGLEAPSATLIAARGTIAECEAQYQKDSVICRIVKTETCLETSNGATRRLHFRLSPTSAKFLRQI